MLSVTASIEAATAEMEVARLELVKDFDDWYVRSFGEMAIDRPTQVRWHSGYRGSILCGLLFFCGTK